MSSLLLLLPLLCLSASAIVDHCDLIQTLTQYMASRASFALYAVGCHYFSDVNAPASAIILDVLRSGRLLRRVVTVICDCSPRSCQIWWHGYMTRVLRVFGAKYFTLIDLTKVEVPRGFIWAPFSFVPLTMQRADFVLLLGFKSMCDV